QRGHLPEGGPYLPHLLPPAIRPGPRHPGAHHPGPLRHVDRGRVLNHLRELLGHLRAVTAVPRHPGAVRLVFPRGHRRLAFPRETGRNEAARGTARGKPNLIGVLESDSTQPARSPPPPDCYPGAKRQGPHGVTGSTRPSSTPDGRARRPFTAITPGSPQAPAGQPGRHRAPWNRSRRRPAHGQHTCRQQRRPVTTRTRPAAQVSREPHAARTHRLLCRSGGTPPHHPPTTSAGGLTPIRGLCDPRCCSFVVA